MAWLLSKQPSVSIRREQFDDGFLIHVSRGFDAVLAVGGVHPDADLVITVGGDPGPPLSQGKAWIDDLGTVLAVGLPGVPRPLDEWSLPKLLRHTARAG